MEYLKKWRTALQKSNLEFFGFVPRYSNCIVESLMYGWLYRRSWSEICDSLSNHAVRLMDTFKFMPCWLHMMIKSANVNRAWNKDLRVVVIPNLNLHDKESCARIIWFRSTKIRNWGSTNITTSQCLLIFCSVSKLDKISNNDKERLAKNQKDWVSKFGLFAKKIHLLYKLEARNIHLCLVNIDSWAAWKLLPGYESLLLLGARLGDRVNKCQLSMVHLGKITRFFRSDCSFKV